MAERELKDSDIFEGSKAVKPKPKFIGKVIFKFLFFVLPAAFLATWLFSGSTLEVSGKAHAVIELEVTVLTEGILKEVNVENARHVKRGELLFKLDNDKLGIKLIRAVQERETLEDEVKRLDEVIKHNEKCIERGKILLENGVIGKLEVEKLELEHSKNRDVLSERKRELEEIPLKIKSLQSEKERLDITTPFDGVFLGDISKREGTYLKKGEVLGLLFSPDKFYFDALLKETDTEKIKEGDLAEVSFKAFGGVCKGKVAQIDEQATEEIEKVFKIKHVVRIRILLEDLPSGLRPGMQGKAKIFPSLEEKAKVGIRSILGRY